MVLEMKFGWKDLWNSYLLLEMGSTQFARFSFDLNHYFSDIIGGFITQHNLFYNKKKVKMKITLYEKLLALPGGVRPNNIS